MMGENCEPAGKMRALAYTRNLFHNNHRTQRLLFDPADPGFAGHVLHAAEHF